MLAVMLVGGSALQAQEDKTGWSIRLNGTWTIPDRNHFNNSGFVRLQTITDETFGLALSTEYRFSETVGLEVGVQAGNESTVRFKIMDPEGAILDDPIDGHPEDDLGFTILDAALNIYITSGTVDLYIGPVIGYIFYDNDLNILVGRDLLPASVKIDDDVAFGAVLGLDIDFSNSDWFFTSSIKYLDASYDAEVFEGGRPAEEIDFDPLIIRLGLGYRF
jgi:hypothetical protein